VSKLQGPIGPPGFNGSQGPIGPAGPPGFNVTQGPRGIMGPQRFNGSQGAQGQTGPQGSKGVENFSQCEHKTKSSTGSQAVMAGYRRSPGIDVTVEEKSVRIRDAVK